MLLKRMLKLAMLSALCLSCAQGDQGGGTGGDNGTGGSTSTGGTTGTGGTTSTGGTTGTGGVVGTGGLVGTGGTQDRRDDRHRRHRDRRHQRRRGQRRRTRAPAGRPAPAASSAPAGTARRAERPATERAAPPPAARPARGGTGGAAAASAENAGASCAATAGALLSADNKKLPNPFAMHDGTIISTKAQWECRRNEVKADLEKYEIGPKQDPRDTVAATLSGKTLSVKVTIGSDSITLTSAISGSGSCVVIGMDGTLQPGHRAAREIPFSSNQVVQIHADEQRSTSRTPSTSCIPSL